MPKTFSYNNCHCDVAISFSSQLPFVLLFNILPFSFGCCMCAEFNLRSTQLEAFSDKNERERKLLLAFFWLFVKMLEYVFQ